MSKIVLPAGKPQVKQFWNLTIAVCTGFVANIDLSGGPDNSVWIDLDDHEKYQHHFGDVQLTHNGINFDVALNNRVFYTAAAESIRDTVLTNSFETSSNFVDCELSFKISGFCARHMPMMQHSITARPAIKIKNISFEQVDVTRLFINDSTFLFENQQSVGDTVFGCNGISTYRFHTPIYDWLLKHRQQLIDL